MDEKIAKILQKTNCFAGNEQRHEIKELVKAIIDFALGPATSASDVREQLYKIYFDLDF